MKGLLDEAEKGVGGLGARTVVIEVSGLQGALDRVGMESQLGGDGPDLPMLGEKEASNVGDVLLINHNSSAFVIRGEKLAAPAAETAKQPLRDFRRGEAGLV